MNDIIQRMILIALSKMTPEIVNEITSFLNKMEKKAKATPNPWDDYLFDLMRMIFKGGTNA